MIGFDANRCIRDLHRHLVRTMEDVQEELLNEIHSGTKHKTDWKKGEIEEFVGMITAHIVGGGWAVMDEWGRGSKMDTTNPELQEYIKSVYWNPLRRDLKIRGRPAGTYVDIFGNIRHSSGKRAGQVLEETKGYEPWEPSRAMRTAIQVMKKGRFNEIVQKAVMEFPWRKYLKIKG